MSVGCMMRLPDINHVMMKNEMGMRIVTHMSKVPKPETSQTIAGYFGCMLDLKDTMLHPCMAHTEHDHGISMKLEKCVVL